MGSVLFLEGRPLLVLKSIAVSFRPADIRATTLPHPNKELMVL